MSTVFICKRKKAEDLEYLMKKKKMLACVKGQKSLNVHIRQVENSYDECSGFG
jgi:hypothetical protein